MIHVNFFLAIDSYLQFKLDSDVTPFAELQDPSIEITVWSIPASNPTIIFVGASQPMSGIHRKVRNVETSYLNRSVSHRTIPLFSQM